MEIKRLKPETDVMITGVTCIGQMDFFNKYIREAGFKSVYDYFHHCAKLWNVPAGRVEKDFGLYLTDDKMPHYVRGEFRKACPPLPYNQTFEYKRDKFIRFVLKHIKEWWRA